MAKKKAKTLPHWFPPSIGMKVPKSLKQETEACLKTLSALKVRVLRETGKDSKAAFRVRYSEGWLMGLKEIL